MRLAGLGLEMVAGIVGMGLAGWFADYWMKTTPGFTIAGVVMGVIGSGYNFIRTAMAVNRSSKSSTVHGTTTTDSRSQPPGSA